jgi:hypothetical protein
MYRKNKFLRISDAKVKEGVFVGRQIRVNTRRKIERSLMWITKSSMVIVQKCHYQSFWNHNSQNYSDEVADLVEYYTAMGCRVSSEVDFLDSHLDLFLENLRAVSNEHG